jgi:hypothetical protein
MGSFEEKCVFNDDIIESKPLEDLWFLEDSSDSREDSPQRINNLYWESQLTLLEVYTFSSSYISIHTFIVQKKI